MSMCIGFNGVGEIVTTLRVEEDAQIEEGSAIVLTDSGEVGLGTDGGRLCGVVLHQEEDGLAAVQLGGLAEVRCAAAGMPEIGYAALCVDGAGCVKTTEDGGTDCLIVSVDQAAGTAVIKLEENEGGKRYESSV